MATDPVQETVNRTPKGYQHVYQIDDLEYIKRFLILGRPEPVYEVGGKLLENNMKQARAKIESIIADEIVKEKLKKEETDNRKEIADGKQETKNPVVHLIRKINSDYRNISQNPVLYCLAVCARSDHKATKTAAFQILNDVCRIPTHLFQFIEYYTLLTKEHCQYTQDESAKDERKEQESTGDNTQKKRRLTKKVNHHKAYGWGRAFKHAISKWFLSKDPEHLVYLLTKYRRRCGWSVKTVIRLAHIKSEDIIVKKRGKVKDKAVIAETDEQKDVGKVEDKTVIAETDEQKDVGKVEDKTVIAETDEQKDVRKVDDKTVIAETDEQKDVRKVDDKTVIAETDEQKDVCKVDDKTVIAETDEQKDFGKVDDKTVIAETDEQKDVGKVDDKTVIAETDEQKDVGKVDDKTVIAETDEQKDVGKVDDKTVIAETDEQKDVGKVDDKTVIAETDEQKDVGKVDDKTVIAETDEQKDVGKVDDKTVIAETDEQKDVGKVDDKTVIAETDEQKDIGKVDDKTVIAETDEQEDVRKVEDKVVISGTDKQKAVGFILRYFRSSLKKAKTVYQDELLAEHNTVLQKVTGMLANYDVLRSSTETNSVKDKIRKHRYITIEHLSPKVTSERNGRKEIWQYLIRNIPAHALLRHAGFLTKIMVLKADDDDVTKTTRETFKDRLNDCVIPPADPDIPAFVRSFTKNVPLHPFKLLTALLQYKEGHSIRYPNQISGNISSWEPVEKVTTILEEAYKKSESIAKQSSRISKKICVAVDVSDSMTKARVNGADKGIDCRTAAAALAFNIARNGSKVDVLVFDKNGPTVLEVGESFEKFLRAVSDHPLSPSDNTDCSEPLKWAIKNKQTDTDAFVVLTVNENAKDRNPLAMQLEEYRKNTKTKPKVVVCTMNVTTYTGAAKFDPYMLDICGFDSQLPWLIQHFVEEEIGTSVESQ